jgi:hypothetical protein
MLRSAEVEDAEDPLDISETASHRHEPAVVMEGERS